MDTADDDKRTRHFHDYVRYSQGENVRQRLKTYLCFEPIPHLRPNLSLSIHFHSFLFSRHFDCNLGAEMGTTRFMWAYFANALTSSKLSVTQE